jgi:hypothetical protein
VTWLEAGLRAGPALKTQFSVPNFLDLPPGIGFFQYLILKLQTMKSTNFHAVKLISVFNSLTAQCTYESLTRHAMQIDSLKSNQSIGRFPPQPSLLKFRAGAKHSFIPLSPSL